MKNETVEKTRKRWCWALAASLLALVLSFFAVICYIGDTSQTIPRGVTIGGVAVGERTREEALGLLESRLAKNYASTGILFCHDGSLVAGVTCPQIGAEPDFKGAVEAAYALGHAGGGDPFSSFARGWKRLFSRWDVEITPEVVVDRQKLSAILPITPQDAWYDKESGEVMEGRIGILFDASALEKALAEIKPGGTLEFDVEIAEQAITAEELKTLLFCDILGSYTTTVSGSRARKNNVALSAAAVSGTVLLPGEIFDFNAVVGERTAQRGYGTAPSYVNGETVDSLGGGICQTSSTLYAAALLADLEIVERYAHRYASSYIPLGMDATVSWGGPEFRFRNDTVYPVRICTELSGSELTVTLEGTKLEDTYVELTGKTVETVPFTIRYEESAYLGSGEQRVKQSGYTGYTVELYRRLYDGEGNLLSEKTEGRSVYRSRDKIVLVGAKKAELPPKEDAAQEEPPAEGQDAP